MVRDPVWKTSTFNFHSKYFAFRSIKNSFLYPQRVYIVIKNIFFVLFFSGFCAFAFFLKSIISTNKLVWPSSAPVKVILPLWMLLPKSFCIRKRLKLYWHSFVLKTKLYLSTIVSISLGVASSVNVFSGIASIIVNFLILGFKTFKVSISFFPCSLTLFICFSMFHPEEKM